MHVSSSYYRGERDRLAPELLAATDPDEALALAFQFVDLACEAIAMAGSARLAAAMIPNSTDLPDAMDFATRCYAAAERLATTAVETIPKPEHARSS